MIAEDRGKNPADALGKHPILTGLTANTQCNVRRVRVSVSDHRQIGDLYQPELTKEDYQFALQFLLGRPVMLPEEISSLHSHLLWRTRNTRLGTFQSAPPDECNGE